jgi:hypothetical protein
MPHKTWCTYPREPCSCKKEREHEANHHKNWCDYPSGPCDCGLAKRKEEFYGKK